MNHLFLIAFLGLWFVVAAVVFVPVFLWPRIRFWRTRRWIRGLPEIERYERVER